MNLLPAKVLVPTTANRIPSTENAQGVVDRLLDFQINASAFLMDVELLEELETADFANDFDRAFEDFFYQIPEELRWKVFPVKLDEETTGGPAPLPGGRTNNPRIAV
ncbi:hypothetical protein BH09VER1_BH09VER1_14180 [soil metagenome]